MCAQLWVGGLRNVGTRSDVAAQVEVQVNVCTGVEGQATDRGHGKRSGSAGRGTGGWAIDSRHEERSRAQVEAKVHVCVVVGGRATDSRHGKHRCRR